MYFEKPGKDNTEQTLKLAAERGRELGIDEMVLPTTSGATAYRALEICDGFQITAVTYHCGFREPFRMVMAEEVRTDLEREGVKIVVATHALSGVERSIAKKYTGSCPVLLIADTLRLFGQGVKVAVEVSIMAADAGALTGKDIVSLGGTAKGVDSAIILKPACQSDVFDIKIREIVCKPRNF